MEQSKLTFRVDRNRYTKVKKKYHHGQLNALWRHFLISVESLLDADQQSQIIDYLYKQKPLTLPKVKKNDLNEKT